MLNFFSFLIILLSTTFLHSLCGTFTLSSPKFNLTFDTTSGNIVSFIDVLTETELIETNSRYFQFKVDDGWTNHDGVMPDFMFTSVDKVYTDFTISTLPVRTTFEVIGDDISCSIKINNEGSGMIVDEYHFPEFRFKRNLGGNERMYLSRVDGVIIQGLGIDDMWACGSYPGSFSMGLFSFYNDDVGVGFEYQDPHLWTKTIGFETSGGKSYVNLCSQILLPYEPSQPIPEIRIVMFHTKKHWLSTTRHYIPWAQQQKWYKDSLARDTPSWVESDPVVLIEAGLQPERAGPQIMPALSQGEICTQWSESLSEGTLPGQLDHIKMMPIMRGFERYGEYINPFYRPLTIGWVNNFSEPLLAEAINRTRNQGHHSLAMISGVKWHKSRSQKLYDSSYWVRGFYEMIEYPAFSNQLVSSWNGAEPTAISVCTLEKDQSDCIMQSDDGWAGDRTEMCLGHNYGDFQTNFAREVLVDLAETMAEMGLDNFEIDQMNGVGVQPCYNGAHGHPKGYGNWSSKLSQELYKDVRDAGRAINPNFITSIEDPIEFMLPYLDLVGCRPPNINTHPAPMSLADIKDEDGNVERWGFTVPGFVSVYGNVSRCFTLYTQIKTAWPAEWSQDHNVRVGLEALARTFIQGSWLALYLNTYELVNWKIPPPDGWIASDGSYSEEWEAIKQLPEYSHPVHLEYIRNIVRSQFMVLSDYHNKPDLVLVELTQEPGTYIWEKKVWNGTREVDEKQKDFTVFYQGWRLRKIYHDDDDDDERSVAVAFIGYDYSSSHTVGKPFKLDGEEINQDTCVIVTRNGCFREKTVYSDIPNMVTVHPLENIVFEFLEETSSGDNCEMEEERDVCSVQDPLPDVFHASSKRFGIPFGGVLDNIVYLLICVVMMFFWKF